jgi:hypothetical protein
MRRKVLQDIANTLCQMMVGWRMGDDYEQIAELPDGTLFFDLICESVRHSDGSSPKLWISGELSGWLKYRLKVENIDATKLLSATLEVQYQTDRIKTDRNRIVSFDFQCHSRLKTDEAEYKGVLVEKHSYHQRR